MADTAHRLTDEKLEEMESGCLPFIPGVKRPCKKKMADYAASIDKKSTELLQAYKNAETEDEKQKTKRHISAFTASW